MTAMRIQLGLIIGCVTLFGCGGGSGDDTIDARPGFDASHFDAAIDAQGSDGGTALIPEELPDPLPSGPADLSVINYNAGLIQVVLGPEERMPLIQTALKAVDVDVICMEEVWWQYTSPNEFSAEMADTFPYSYWTWTGTSPMGSGLMILSKFPLYRGREIRYTAQDDPPAVDRMAIGATAVADDFHINVLCTHLHAGLDSDDDYTIRGSEIDELDDWADENWPDGPTLLLGDFNSGPVPPSTDVCECDDTGDENPDTCTKCVDADLTSYHKVLETWNDPFAENADICTSGHAQFIDMSLVPGLYPHEPSQRIDHCFYRDFDDEEFKSGQLELTEDPNIEITNPFGDDPATIFLHYLSDHYAIHCVFGPKA